MRHVLERWRASNTARLAALALPTCELWAYGARDPAARPDWSRLGEGAWLLFPDGGAPPAASAPRTLVVLDGSWPQARRMAQRITALRGLPRLTLPAAPGTERMRRPPRPDGLATLMAVARALELLEGPEVARPLDELFAEVVRRARLG